MRPGGLEDMIRLLPEESASFRYLTIFCRGERTEFKEIMRDYDAKVAILAEQGCDVIHPEEPTFYGYGFEGGGKKDSFLGEKA